MSEQKQRQYEGQRTVAEKGGLDKDMRDVATDLGSLRTALVDLLTKLDAEGTLAGDYVASIPVPENTVTKG